MKTDMEGILKNGDFILDVEASEDLYAGQVVDVTGKAVQDLTTTIKGVARYGVSSGEEVALASDGTVANVYVNSSAVTQGDKLMADANDSGSVVPHVVQTNQATQTEILGVALEDVSAGATGKAIVRPQSIQNVS